MSKKYGDETRAAVMAALLSGQSASFVAKEYKIPRSTVQTWKKQYVNGELTIDPTQKKEIGDLLQEYLEANLIAIREQARVLSNPDWLRKQEASQLAILHGVMADKVIRMLEAISRENG